MAHLHKTAHAKIPDNLILIHVHKLLSSSLLDCRHSRVSKTIFVLKFRTPVAKIIKFEFYFHLSIQSNTFYSEQNDNLHHFHVYPI